MIVFPDDRAWLFIINVLCFYNLEGTFQLWGNFPEVPFLRSSSHRKPKSLISHFFPSVGSLNRVISLGVDYLYCLGDNGVKHFIILFFFLDTTGCGIFWVLNLCQLSYDSSMQTQYYQWLYIRFCFCWLCLDVMSIRIIAM